MSNDMEPEVIGEDPSGAEAGEAAEEEGAETWIWMLGALLLGLSGSALLAIGGVFVLPELIAGLRIHRRWRGKVAIGKKATVFREVVERKR